MLCVRPWYVREGEVNGVAFRVCADVWLYPQSQPLFHRPLCHAVVPCPAASVTLPHLVYGIEVSPNQSPSPDSDVGDASMDVVPSHQVWRPVYIGDRDVLHGE